MPDSQTTGLHHVWCEPIEQFFGRIDATGGWPIGKKYVSFAHTDKRECEFGNEYLRTGWWTTIADADEYFLWKLSAAARKKLKAEIKLELMVQLSRIEVLA